MHFFVPKKTWNVSLCLLGLRPRERPCLRHEPPACCQRASYSLHPHDTPIGNTSRDRPTFAECSFLLIVVPTAVVAPEATLLILLFRTQTIRRGMVYATGPLRNSAWKVNLDALQSRSKQVSPPVACVSCSRQWRDPVQNRQSLARKLLFTAHIGRRGQERRIERLQANQGHRKTGQHARLVVLTVVSRAIDALARAGETISTKHWSKRHVVVSHDVPNVKPTPRPTISRTHVVSPQKYRPCPERLRDFLLTSC